MGIFGDSPETSQLLQMITACAASDASVLIQGETGSGKEVVSRELHQRSPRSEHPFVALNCAAIPSQLLESELFGYLKGAYTGATTDRKGRIEQAHRGTLMLDEVGDMPLELQAKLLRFLEDRVVEPLGGTGSGFRVDVRVIAATHKDLNSLVSEGKFREDLYYRLNVIPIKVPPLRERLRDLPMLCSHFCGLHAKGLPGISFSGGSMELLSKYSWPGNIRELSNLINRFSVLFPGREVDIVKLPTSLLTPGLKQTILEHVGETYTEPSGVVEFEESSDSNLLDFFDLSDENDPQEAIPAQQLVESVFDRLKHAVVLPAGGLHAKEILEKFERGLIHAALRQADNNTQASKLLGMERTTFIQKLTRFGIDPKAVK
jgi:sigma-54 specific flagellar transcriptional regulator A